ncbi:hypothetical protein PENTCL1PPCAC_16411, partial [Pristionchus entomophagus]
MFLSPFHYIICIFSSSFNLLLLFLIIFHTHKELKKSHSAMLVTLCIYELFTSFSSFIVFPRIIPLGSEGILCVYSGPCVYLESDYTWFLFYSLVLHGFTMYNFQMTANFCFLYYLVKYQDPGVGRVIQANFLLLSPILL